MATKSKTLLVLFAALMLITAACGRVPADSIGIDAADSEQAVQEAGDDHADDSDDHADDGDDHADDASEIEPSGDADRVLEVELNEFAIEALSFEFTPGETVEFIITNTGVVEHEFRLSNEGRVDEHIAGGHADHDDAMTDEAMAEMDHGEDEMSEEKMAEMMDDTEAHKDDGHSHETEEVHEEEDGQEDEEAHEDEGAHEEEAEEGHEDEAGHTDDGHDADDVTLVLGPGETGTLVFTFPDNAHDFTAAVCLIPGHYEAGMTTDLSYAV